MIGRTSKLPFVLAAFAAGTTLIGMVGVGLLLHVGDCFSSHAQILRELQ